MQSPFAAQELMDYFTFSLRDSTPDLKTCALVCRFWATGCIPPMTTIHRLFIAFTTDQNSTLRISEICNSPFTRLESVETAYVADASVQNILALQQLFSLPTLRYVTVKMGKPEILDTDIFRRCSPALQHLNIGCLALFSALPDPYILGSTPLTALMSLMFRHTPMVAATLHGFLHTILLPFTLSTVKALGIWAASTVKSYCLSPVINNVKILSIDVAAIHIGLNLPAFPQLTFLHIGVAKGLF
ncbi:hypothetical protein DFH06DRAFT_1190589 [Mycena polygramma]|nr:hypothetical protein DFH06DRAFT_1190589 [Mycena polygramma]